MPERGPPIYSDVVAEGHLVGQVFIEPEVLERAVVLLPPEDAGEIFTDIHNRIFYRVVCHVAGQSDDEWAGASGQSVLDVVQRLQDLMREKLVSEDSELYRLIGVLNARIDGFVDVRDPDGLEDDFCGRVWAAWWTRRYLDEPRP